MLVMGGTVGAGIFINPYVVAQRVHTPWLVLGAWMAGGLIALTGAFIWAELADRMTQLRGVGARLRHGSGSVDRPTYRSGGLCRWWSVWRLGAV